MPPIEEADFVHDIVVWERTGLDRDNEPVLAAPVQVRGRWARQRRMTTDAQGTPVELTAKAAVPLTLKERSVFWQGKLAGWEDAGGQDLYEAVGTSGATGVDGKGERHEYDLARFRGKLPARTPEPYT